MSWTRRNWQNWPLPSKSTALSNPHRHRTKGQFYLIAGERRWRASRIVGLKEVPVVVKEATSQDMLELAIIENVQRADLNALEEAYAYQQLMEEFGMTQEEIAESVGKARSTVANLLRLLTLPENIQQAVIDGEISGAHARALLPLPTAVMQTNAMKRITDLNLSVRQTEQLVKTCWPQKNLKRKHATPCLLNYSTSNANLKNPWEPASTSTKNGKVVKLSSTMTQTKSCKPSTKSSLATRAEPVEARPYSHKLCKFSLRAAPISLTRLRPML
ncbi:MAG: ParB/RepB/Spo0J family partition protein [Chloroflexi bacterium]|nr:ParB/RepB/Spo0J family partition protein [Chloroflexota bacterium]